MGFISRQANNEFQVYKQVWVTHSLVLYIQSEMKYAALWEWLRANSGLDFLWKGWISVINYLKNISPTLTIKMQTQQRQVDISEFEASTVYKSYFWDRHQSYREILSWKKNADTGSASCDSLSSQRPLLKMVSDLFWIVTNMFSYLLECKWTGERAELGQDSPLLFIELGKVRTFPFGLIHMIIIKYLFHKWSKTRKIESGITGKTKHVFLSNTLQWIFHF